jgi:hypothetical protein
MFTNVLNKFLTRRAGDENTSGTNGGDGGGDVSADTFGSFSVRPHAGAGCGRGNRLGRALVWGTTPAAVCLTLPAVLPAPPRPGDGARASSMRLV